MLPSEGDEARHFRPFVLAALQDATHELAALAEADSVEAAGELGSLPDLPAHEVHLLADIADVRGGEVLLSRPPYLHAVHVNPQVLFHPFFHDFHPRGSVPHACMSARRVRARGWRAGEAGAGASKGGYQPIAQSGGAPPSSRPRGSASPCGEGCPADPRGLTKRLREEGGGGVGEQRGCSKRPLTVPQNNGQEARLARPAGSAYSPGPEPPRVDL